MPCLDENTLAEIVDGSIDDARRREVDNHIDECDDCRRLFAELDTFTATTKAPRAQDGVLSPGTDVDGFEIVRLVGLGGMGAVYLARDPRLARKVALKLIRPDSLDPDALARFEHEARAMARVSHPNIVTVHAVGDYLGSPYVAMEYVEGRELRAVIDAGMTCAGALRIAGEVAKALGAAHKRGVVHRDLKPENVLIAEDDRVRVLDFGLARVGNPVELGGSEHTTLVAGALPLAALKTQQGGTPFYMAPEQWRGSGTSPATDAWAFGLMLHEMITGRHLFDSTTDMVSLARTACLAKVTVPGDSRIPAELHALIQRCVQRDPGLRPSATELVQALEAWTVRTSAPDRAVAITPLAISATKPLNTAVVVGIGATALVAAISIAVVTSSSEPSAPAAVPPTVAVTPVETAPPEAPASVPSADPVPFESEPALSVDATTAAPLPRPPRPVVHVAPKIDPPKADPPGDGEPPPSVLDVR